jgi:hypothetical protein
MVLASVIVTLFVRIGSEHAFSPTVTAMAVAEAARIWAPYGVIIETAGSDSCGSDADDRTVLSVVNATAAVKEARWESPLGAIRFDSNGQPGHQIQVYAAALRNMIDGVSWLGMRPWFWSASLRDEIWGRILGRVLAHEIGHFMLRSPGHQRSGLMRAVHFMDEFANPSGDAFTLNHWDVSRLTAVMARTTAIRSLFAPEPDQLHESRGANGSSSCETVGLLHGA